MPSMHADSVKLLGTAGARHVMARQLRYSAGTYLQMSGQRLLLDPGPGTLVRCARSRPRIDPTALDGVVLTHGHIDHSGDVNAVLDALTAGGLSRRGALYAPRECLEGPSAVVLTYVRECLAQEVALAPTATYSLGALRFRTSPTLQHPMETYGLVFEAEGRPSVGFVTDTRYFGGLADVYRGVDLLIVNVVLLRHTPGRDIMHLSLPDAEQIIFEVRPRKAVLTHFGMTMLKAKPRELAAAMSDRLGLEVVAASDGMTVELGGLSPDQGSAKPAT
jgi:ribonuclease BN (tRNA processing enzyme)